MNIICSADWHLNDNPRDRYRHDWQKQLRKLCIEHDVDTLVFLGDLTDETDNHSSALVNEIIDHLSKLVDVCEHVYLMRGNHDYVDPSCPFFKFIEAMPGFSWINTPEKRIVGGLHALFLPHTRDHKAEWVRDCPRCGGSGFTGPETGYDGVCGECGGQREEPVYLQEVDVIFAHNTFAGTVSESGQTLGGISPSIFPKGTTVISGDIHMPQVVGPVEYVGSPYTVDFGDAFKPRVLLYKGGKWRSIPCAGTQKRLVVATDVGNAISKLNAVKGDIVKLRVALNPKDKDQWPTIKRELFERATEMGVKLHAIEALVDQPTANKRYKVSSGKMQRDDEVLKAYCTQRGIDENRQYTGLDILKER